MRMSSRRAQLFLAVALGGGAWIAACGSDDSSTFNNGKDGGDGTLGDSGGGFPVGDGSLPSYASLYFDPPTATINVDGSGPKTASFSLKGKKADGTVVDVVPQSVAFDHPGIATVTAAEPAIATASGPYGGSGQIHAVYNGQSAIATLEVHVALIDVGAGVTSGAVAALNGVTATTPNDPSNASGKLLYPYDATVFPLGLSTPTLQWNGSAAGDIYRLHYEEKNYSFDGYYPLAALPGKMALAQAKWDQITASNDAATAPDPLQFKLYRYDGTSAYFDANESWTIAPASVNGAIYYWTTSNGGHLTRINPGAGSVPTAVDNGECMGCHGVSSDGTTLVASIDNNTLPDGGAAIYREWVSFDLQSGPVPATNKLHSDLYGGNIAVNHDGKYIVFGGKENGPPAASTSGLHFGDPKTGQMITGSGIESWPMSTTWSSYEYLDPAFSPTGVRIATILADSSLGDWNKSELFVADFNETTKAFTGLKSLVRFDAFPTAQWALGYPSFTPDDNWIAFHVGDHGAGCHDGCNSATPDVASLYLVNAVSGGTPIKLDKLNDSSLNASDHNEAFEPTFNPIERGGYYWVVFSSERTWGNTLAGHGTSGDKRLWVAAIDKNIGTLDPSHPPFYLEGQIPGDSNMRGFWALSACTATGATGPDGGAACTSGFECCSGFCDKGACVDVTQVACKAIGDSCSTASDCCNSDIVGCVGGRCQENAR